MSSLHPDSDSSPAELHSASLTVIDSGISFARPPAPQEMIDETSLPDRPVYLHFDTDLIDPRQAPAMNYPAAGGPSAEQVAALFRKVARTGRLAAVSLSSWNPALDPDGSTQALCMGLLAELLT